MRCKVLLAPGRPSGLFLLGSVLALLLAGFGIGPSNRLALAEELPDPGIQAELESLSQTPKEPTSQDAITVRLRLKNDQNVSFLRVGNCRFSPFYCSLPKFMTKTPEGTWETKLNPETAGAEMGYNITIRYNNGVEEQLPKNRSWTEPIASPGPVGGYLYYQYVVLDKGGPVPDFTVPVGGKQWTLSAFQGRNVLLHYDDFENPAPWIQSLKTFKEKHPDVILLTVDSNSSHRPEMLSWLKLTYGIPWDLAAGSDRASLKLRSLDRSKIVLLDSQGHLAAEFRTPPTLGEMEAAWPEESKGSALPWPFLAVGAIGATVAAGTYLIRRRKRRVP